VLTTPAVKNNVEHFLQCLRMINEKEYFFQKNIFLNFFHVLQKKKERKKLKRRHDTQHNDIQFSDTQHYDHVFDTQHK
jgi:hypothetical protein